MPGLCLVCPFDLDRPSGTPLRALATKEALEAGGVRPLVLATTGAHGATAVPGAIRAGKLAIGRFVVSAARLLARAQPDVVHCVTPLGLLAAQLARPRLRGARVVVEYHGAAEHEMAHMRPAVRACFTALDRWLVRRADAVVCMTEGQLGYLRDRCGVRAPMIVAWGPVDLARPAPPPRPSRPWRVGYFGNALPWQGLPTLLAALEQAPDAEIELHVAGVEENALEGAADPRVRLLGVLPREQAATAMEDCHVLVSPRLGGAVSDLQYPSKLSSYLAAGRAVIVTDVSDQGRIVRQAGCGWVVPPADAAALAEALREVAAAPFEDLAERGARARAFAEQHLGYDRLRALLAEAYGRPGLS